MMKRRAFVRLLSGAAAWPLAARAQSAGRPPTIGLLGVDALTWRTWTDAFIGRLRELGWIEDRTVAVEYRWSDGHPERIAEIAAEFVRQKVDVIVSFADAIRTISQATSAIPVVFILATDPINSGVITSLARPGGNITGLSQQQSDTAGKRLQLLREAVPNLRRLAIIANVGMPNPVIEMNAVQLAARAFGLEVAPIEIRQTTDIAPAFTALTADALYVVGDGLIAANSTRVITHALSGRLPTIFNNRAFVQVGGLMSYGPDFADQFRRAAELVDKILRGTKPGEIPVEQPTKFELVINLDTAKALSLSIPQTLLATADEVIE
jgi:putative tryptophan/tyrosine transport system substrate-binding protein